MKRWLEPHTISPDLKNSQNFPFSKFNLLAFGDTLEPGLEDLHIGHKNMVSQDRW